MITSFLKNSTFNLKIQTSQPISAPYNEREPVKILIIGSREGVTKIMHTFYRLGFAEISEWSPLQPTKNPGEVMTILVRQILKE